MEKKGRSGFQKCSAGQETTKMSKGSILNQQQFHNYHNTDIQCIQITVLIKCRFSLTSFYSYNTDQDYSHFTWCSGFQPQTTKKNRRHFSQLMFRLCVCKHKSFLKSKKRSRFILIDQSEPHGLKPQTSPRYQGHRQVSSYLQISWRPLAGRQMLFYNETNLNHIHNLQVL